MGSEPQGFDYYEATPGQGRYFQPQYRQNQNWRDNKTYDGYSSDVIGDRTIYFLENFRDKNKPFMLMMQFKANDEEVGIRDPRITLKWTGQLPIRSRRR